MREVKDCMRSKGVAYKNAGKAEDWEQFRAQQRRTRKLIKKGKRENECKLARSIKVHCKRFFGYVKREKLVGTNVGPLQAGTGEFVVENRDKTEKLNSYFPPVLMEEGTEKSPKDTRRSRNL